MLTGHFFSADFRGRLFDQVTSTTMYFSLATDNPVPVDVPMATLWGWAGTNYLRPLREVISNSWSIDYWVVTELHRRGEPYQIFRQAPAGSTGLWPEGAYPPQVAAPLRLTGVSLDGSRQNRRFLWVPGVPRFTVPGGAGGNFSDAYRDACTTAAQSLCVATNFLAAGGIRVFIRPAIILRRQPAGQPANVFTHTVLTDGRGPARPGRIIRRTIGRGW